MNWWEIEVEVAEELAEPVIAALLGRFPRGLAERHSVDRVNLTAFEEAASEGPGASSGALLEEVERLLGERLSAAESTGGPDAPVRARDWRVSVRARPEADYVAMARAGFRKFRVGDLTVYPSWDEPSPADGERAILIDPGLAFGTGHHATTLGCLELMHEMPLESARVLDVGTGTGVLALAAVRWGAECCRAIDNDSLAVKAAAENVRRNRMADRIEVGVEDLDALRNWPADIVLANVDTPAVTRLLDRLVDLKEPPREIVLSGMMESDWPAVESRIEESGYRVRRVIVRDPWVSVWAGCDE